jgi:hypothetical protein
MLPGQVMLLKYSCRKDTFTGIELHAVSNSNRRDQAQRGLPWVPQKISLDGRYRPSRPHIAA